MPGQAQTRDAVPSSSACISLRWFAGITGLFILSRVSYYFAGIRFQSGTLEYFDQFADPLLLRNDLLNTVLYMHGQPPLFNLFLGLVLKISPHGFSQVFNIIYLLFGLALSLLLFGLMVRLGVAQRLSFLLTGVFILTPACIVYENSLFYTCPVTLLLVAAAWFLHRFLKSQRVVDSLLFFTCLGTVVLVRSFFHPFWFMIVLAALLIKQPGFRRAVAAGAIIPLALILLLQCRNLYLFDSLSTSSWFGMSIAKITTFQLPVEKRVAMNQRGELSGLAMVFPFSRLQIYRDFQIDMPPSGSTGIRILDQETKSTGSPNLNNKIYIHLSRAYLTDAAYVVLRHPEAYLKGILSAVTLFFNPTAHQGFLYWNLNKIRLTDRLCNIVLYGHPSAVFHVASDSPWKRISGAGIFLFLIWAFSLVYGGQMLFRPAEKEKADPVARGVLIFLWFNIVYVSLVGNLFEYGENNRFRFMIDPFLLVFAGLMLERFKSRGKKRYMPVKESREHLGK